MDYSDFLSHKQVIFKPTGPRVTENDIHPMLFPFQRALTTWAIRKGHCAVFADTGLGKTFIQLEWARLIGEQTLIVAPLSVARQTVREGQKIGLDVHYTRDGNDLVGNLNITNYEMLEHFDPADFGAVVLDESSILKSLNGKTRQRLIEMGFIKGAHLRLERLAPLGDPMELVIKGYHLSLRKEEGSCITVTPEG